ncbi:MAG: alpha/beta fold hydrolase [Christensenellaceae bacterium]|jgi:pimeloyl-ACP methyl ester carboxylesterase
MIKRYGKNPCEIALLHGGPGAIGSLRPLARALTKSYGTAELLQTKYTIAALLEELSSDLQSVTTKPITLLGHSWGAWLAILYAAQFPALVKQLILVGCGPLTEAYVPQILAHRLANLSEADAKEYRAILAALDDPAYGNKEGLLQKLGALTKSSDNYNLIPMQDETVLNSAMYTAIWQQAAALRKSGALLQSCRKIRCPITLIQGAYDPHPLEGVTAPLQEAGISYTAHLLENAGYSPFYEAEASAAFYEILHGLL